MRAWGGGGAERVEATAPRLSSLLLEPRLPPFLPPCALLGIPALTPPPSRPDPLPPRVSALNNFLLFGKRNNAPDFTRGKQSVEQNKEQM